MDVDVDMDVDSERAVSMNLEVLSNRCEDALNKVLG